MSNPPDKLSPFETAFDEVIHEAPNHLLPSEGISLAEALGRVISSNIVSSFDSPAGDNSAMDGYCMNHLDTQSTSPSKPVSLPISGRILAGHPLKQIPDHSASYITTGGMIPQGADCVVKIEDTFVDSMKNEIIVTSPIPRGIHVRFRGGDIKEGDIVLSSGTFLNPFSIGALANLGNVAVNVVQKPRVAILTSGDEVVMPFEDPQPWQIRDSNSLTISAQVSEAGGVPIMLGILKDNVDQAIRKIQSAWEVANVIITCGGVSVDEMDPFIAAFQEMKVEKKVHGVAIKPGKPFFFGLIKGKPIFGLPGNQVSSAITFELFVRPFLKRMLHCKIPDRKIFYLPLNQPSFNRSDRDLFKRGRFFSKDQKTFANPLEKQESHLRTSLLEMELLVRHPKSVLELPAGHMVECRIINL